jgi:hypothetical protein
MTVLYDPEIIRSGSLAAAILEFDAQQLRGKVQRAEEVITYRIQELAAIRERRRTSERSLMGFLLSEI